LASVGAADSGVMLDATLRRSSVHATARH
jgi:hypothetical protein